MAIGSVPAARPDPLRWPERDRRQYLMLTDSLTSRACCSRPRPRHPRDRGLDWAFYAASIVAKPFDEPGAQGNFVALFRLAQDVDAQKSERPCAVVRAHLAIKQSSLAAVPSDETTLQVSTPSVEKEVIKAGHCQRENDRNRRHFRPVLRADILRTSNQTISTCCIALLCHAFLRPIALTLPRGRGSHGLQKRVVVTGIAYPSGEDNPIDWRLIATGVVSGLLVTLGILAIGAIIG